MQTSSTAAITKQICWKQFPNETVSKTLMHLFRRLLRSPYSPCISCRYSKLIECYQSLINGKQWNSQHNSTLRAIALLSVYVCWSSRCEKSVSILSHHTIGCSYVALTNQQWAICFFSLSFAIRFVRTRYLNALKIHSVLFSVSAGADVVRLLLLLFPVI